MSYSSQIKELEIILKSTAAYATPEVKAQAKRHIAVLKAKKKKEGPKKPDEKIRKARVVKDVNRGSGYTIKLVDGKPFKGSYGDTYGWYLTKKDAIEAIKSHKQLQFTTYTNRS